MKPFAKDGRSGAWQLLASGFGEPDTLEIRTDARIYGAVVKAGESLTYNVGAGRHAYLVPAIGRIDVSGMVADARDGVALGGGAVTITALDDSEIVMVDAV